MTVYDMVTLLTLDIWVDKVGLYSAMKMKIKGGRVCFANKRVEREWGSMFGRDMG